MGDGFTAKEVRWVVRISQRELDYWARTELVVPSINNAHGRQTKRIYSMGDLIRLATVKRLRSRGISLQKIRMAVDYLKGISESEKSLEDFDLKADRGAVFILTEDPKIWLDIVRNPGQFEWSMVKETSREIEEKVKSLNVRGKTAKEIHPSIDKELSKLGRQKHAN